MFYGAMTVYGGCYNELERVVNMTVKVILPSLPKNNNFMICIAELITEYSVLFDVLAIHASTCIGEGYLLCWPSRSAAALPAPVPLYLLCVALNA